MPFEEVFAKGGVKERKIRSFKERQSVLRGYAVRTFQVGTVNRVQATPRKKIKEHQAAYGNKKDFRQLDRCQN